MTVRIKHEYSEEFKRAMEGLLEELADWEDFLVERVKEEANSPQEAEQLFIEDVTRKRLIQGVSELIANSVPVIVLTTD